MATYMTTRELAERLRYDERTVREQLKDTVLIEGRHYVRPFGGRKTLYVWENIEADMWETSSNSELGLIPMANGGFCHG